jgi:hypothetical protein
MEEGDEEGELEEAARRTWISLEPWRWVLRGKGRAETDASLPPPPFLDNGSW